MYLIFFTCKLCKVCVQGEEFETYLKPVRREKQKKGVYRRDCFYWNDFVFRTRMQLKHFFQDDFRLKFGSQTDVHTFWSFSGHLSPESDRANTLRQNSQNFTFSFPKKNLGVNICCKQTEAQKFDPSSHLHRKIPISKFDERVEQISPDSNFNLFFPIFRKVLIDLRCKYCRSRDKTKSRTRTIVRQKTKQNTFEVVFWSKEVAPREDQLPVGPDRQTDSREIFFLMLLFYCLFSFVDIDRRWSVGQTKGRG